MQFFAEYNCLAVTSDRSIDFTPADFDAPLSKAQSAYLKRKTGHEIPSVLWRKQIHGDDILTVQGSLAGCPDADALITNQTQRPIAIRTADCVPVFILDPVRRAIGLAHAGWKGTTKAIAAKTVRQMQDKFGCACYDLLVAIGPSIRSCCYAVGPEFEAHFPQEVSRRNGQLYADVVAANKRQLLETGVRSDHIVDSNVCTCCHTNYFSFRREANQAGRMISLMMLL